MGLFDGLSGMLENAISSHAGGLSGLMSDAFNGMGGLNGVLAKLNDAGLGPQVNSWLGKGDNVPVSAEEISSVLGSEQLLQLAGKLGIPMDQVANVLANQLPAVVDQASPNGTLETA
ncbi:YidB family protein [Rhizobium sp. LjRoot254]|uniref:YidB family protein n=1 Tax=Rhizobium sp. LjRoot254 TaxID=3342297 RepID=UPI003ECD660B